MPPPAAQALHAAFSTDPFCLVFCIASYFDDGCNAILFARLKILRLSYPASALISILTGSGGGPGACFHDCCAPYIRIDAHAL